MRFNRLQVIFLVVFLSSCALLGRPSFEDVIVVESGEIKQYVLVLKGKVPNMVHDESQMFWPTYHEVFYKIHVDQLSGVVKEDDFKISYKDKPNYLKSYSGSLVFKGNKVVIKMLSCPRPENCFNAEFNGSYKLENKI
ncbi:hypothetical protein GCM10009114_37000 [Aliiglaciecola litoralis]|uniref:Lipoprotein n=2 Tax=Aliiglaciecola litoralis TaxID=582857 RepID=A0ABN1LTZ5_9ALTE